VKARIRAIDVEIDARPRCTRYGCKRAPTSRCPQHGFRCGVHARVRHTWSTQPTAARCNNCHEIVAPIGPDTPESVAAKAAAAREVGDVFRALLGVPE
jgi:hypothetical protein